MRFTLGRVALLLVLSAAAACGTETDPAGGTGSTILADLADRTFVTTNVSGHHLVPGTQVRLMFTADSIGAQAGCNSLSGGVSMSGDTLVTEPLAMTEMACPQPRMDQDTWLAGFLGSAPRLSLEGDRLTLAGDGPGPTIMELTDEASEAAPLTDTDWRLDSVFIGSGQDGAVSSVPRGAAEAGIRLDAGRLDVDTGCNTGGADADWNEHTLTAGPLTLTERACGRALDDLEAVFRDVLTAPTSYVIEGDRLTLTATDEHAGLSFRIEPAP